MSVVLSLTRIRPRSNTKHGFQIQSAESDTIRGDSDLPAGSTTLSNVPVHSVPVRSSFKIDKHIRLQLKAWMDCVCAAQLFRYSSDGVCEKRSNSEICAV